jgi:chemotaxis protein methyltransferase CheR
MNTNTNIVPGLIEISSSEFKLISDLVYSRFGINLTDKKKALVKGRLNKLLKQLGFESFKSYYDYVINDKTGQSLLTLVDKISTNHSFFFREKSHFVFLSDILLPQLVDKKKLEKSNIIRIWCAGCAQGEEPFTIAMLMKEYFGSDITGWDIGILATDISKEALTQAIEGKYSKEKISEVPITLRNKYFKFTDNDYVKVNDDIKKMILFKRLNLMNENLPFKGNFDIIFCRNVMIYFDQITKENLVKKFYKFTNDGGYLFVGHSESLLRETCPYKYIKPAIYCKRDF